MVDVSIIITSYNSKDNIASCINSIVHHPHKYSYEIIVVDDASSDGTADTILNKFPQVQLMRNDKNIGYVRSNNIGIGSATGRYVLSLNNDTEIIDGAIDKLAQYLDDHDDVGSVGPKLLNPNGTIQYQCRRSFPDPFNSFMYFSGISRLFPKNKELASYLMTAFEDKDTIEVDCICGAAMMVRGKVIDNIGAMDEDYHMYGDDLDWCFRIKQDGWKIVYLPQAEIVHLGGQGGSRKMLFKNIYEFHRSMAVFYKKHLSKKYFILINALVYTGIWLKFIFAILNNLFRREKFVGTLKP